MVLLSPLFTIILHYLRLRFLLRNDVCQICLENYEVPWNYFYHEYNFYLF